MVQYGESLVGLGGTPSHNIAVQKQAANILFPYDPPEVRLQLTQSSSNCMLAVLAALRFAEVDDPDLHVSHGVYPPGSSRAVGFRNPAALLVNIAQRADALLDIKATQRNPQRGDIFIVGHGMGTHGLLVRSYNPLDATLESVDGGQGAHGAGIEYRTRRLGWDDASQKFWLYVGPNLDQRDRDVTHWIDGSKIICGSLS